MQRLPPSQQKKRPGRAATAGDPSVTVRLPEDMVRAIDRLAHRGSVSRSEALRRLVEQALAVADVSPVVSPSGPIGDLTDPREGGRPPSAGLFRGR